MYPAEDGAPLTGGVWFVLELEVCEVEPVPEVEPWACVWGCVWVCEENWDWDRL